MTGLPTGEDALEKFLFESKQGNCEFFASSFALILRGAGVPARLVGGYLGGEYNELGGYFLVSEGDGPCLGRGFYQRQRLGAGRSEQFCPECRSCLGRLAKRACCVNSG